MLKIAFPAKCPSTTARSNRHSLLLQRGEEFEGHCRETQKARHEEGPLASPKCGKGERMAPWCRNWRKIWWFFKLEGDGTSPWLFSSRSRSSRSSRSSSSSIVILKHQEYCHKTACYRSGISPIAEEDTIFVPKKGSPMPPAPACLRMKTRMQCQRPTSFHPGPDGP